MTQNKGLQRDFPNIQKLAEYIEKEEPNHKINVIGMVTDATIRNYGANNSRQRYTFNLSDATGSVPVTIWEISEEAWSKNFTNGNIIKVVGVSAGTYNDKAQLTMDKDMAIEIIDKEKVNIELFRMTLVPETKELMERLKNVANTIPAGSEYRNAIDWVIKKPWFKDFLTHPAAAKVHHADRGGLLFHTVTMMERAAKYEAPFAINRPLLVTGAFLHDLGKIWELEVQDDGSGKYTKKGILFGHIFMGAQLPQEMFSDGIISEEVSNLLTHMILSHHGELEWGSPVVPAFLEAGLLHDLDKEDARIFQYQAAYTTIQSGEMSDARIFPIGTNVYRPDFAVTPVVDTSNGTLYKKDETTEESSVVETEDVKEEEPIVSEESAEVKATKTKAKKVSVSKKSAVSKGVSQKTTTPSGGLLKVAKKTSGSKKIKEVDIDPEVKPEPFTKTEK